MKFSVSLLKHTLFVISVFVLIHLSVRSIFVALFVCALLQRSLAFCQMRSAVWLCALLSWRVWWRVRSWSLKVKRNLISSSTSVLRKSSISLTSTKMANCNLTRSVEPWFCGWMMLRKYNVWICHMCISVYVCSFTLRVICNLIAVFSGVDIDTLSSERWNLVNFWEP